MSASAWAIFCHGRGFWRHLRQVRRATDLASKDDDDEEDDESDDSCDPDAEANQVLGGCIPSTTLLATMRPSAATKVLGHMAEWVDVLGGLGERADVAQSQGMWLYAILCRVEKPLFPDDLSCLRTIAIACSKQRERIVKEGGDLALVNSLSLFICLVARNFSQKDLAD